MKTPEAAAIIESPIGRLYLAGTVDGLTSLWFTKQMKERPRNLACRGQAGRILEEAQRQLTEYFDGARKDFDLPLEFHGTRFQKEAWRGLLTIPYGQTVSYGEQARRIGRPKAVRAIGTANGANPIAVIVPCHRVIGANGSLTGYGGGMETKQKLLALENPTLNFSEA